MEFKFGEAFYIPYTSVDEIPLEEFKNLHKQYWNFIADLNLSEKPMICSSITKKIIHVNAKCFACAYEKIIKKRRYPIYPYIPGCAFCPLLIYRSNTFSTLCTFHGSLYYKFIDIIDPDSEDRSKIARQIANLKWEDLHNEMAQSSKN